ncbi:MAG: right-handed parallel beta-helix repeat-containing protein [Bacteroidales bacterium]|jgi:hypothetical protein|nr:right-handed parallel beta-helix repeat-containing protein [Bacteroidales bacterium]
MKKIFLLVLTLSALWQFAIGQMSRGYYNSPYLRYEAESGECESNGTFLPATFVQTEVQSEASNQTAVKLTERGGYIQWLCQSEADGLTIRFSLPDSPDGTGSQGTLALYVNDTFARNIVLNSYWAWQYFLRTMSNSYPDNTPNATTKFARMSFDETHILLDKKIPAGATFKIVKTLDDTISYIIDFVELEEVPAPLTFEDIADENKILYDSATSGSLVNFISSNAGKTIFFPSGKYISEYRLNVGAKTKIIGAGMWHTEFYFSASSDSRETYNRRGIELNGDSIVIEGLYINTINNKRYYNNDDRYQVGKGIMGGSGSSSAVKNVWIEHFECGAWIENADNILFSHCRFRNNYADGINFCYGTRNSVFEYSSLRNNGDDDLATWSRSGKECYNNIFQYCTAENNWRASSLGFFGGKQNIARHIVIIDPMEAGFRITSDFPGVPFSTDGVSEMHDISVYNGGCAQGTRGTTGDLWGNRQGALHINASSQYDLLNFNVYNIDLYNSKDNAIYLGCGSKYIKNIFLRNIKVYGAGNYGIYFNGTKGDAKYCNLEFSDIGAATDMNAVPAAFSFLPDEGCDTLPAGNLGTMDEREVAAFDVFVSCSGGCNGGRAVGSGDCCITVSGLSASNDSLFVFDIEGRLIYSVKVKQPAQTVVIPVKSGVYLIKYGAGTKKVLVM